MSLSIDTAVKDTLQYTIDKHLTYPGQSAIKRAIHIVADKSASRYPLDLDIRLLALVQSVISLILLPFKIMATTFLGLTTVYSNLQPSEETAEKIISFTYSLGSLAIHATAIPIGLITLFCPIESLVSKLPGKNDSRQELPPNLLDAGVSAFCGEFSPLTFPSRPSADAVPSASSSSARFRSSSSSDASEAPDRPAPAEARRDVPPPYYSGRD